MGWANCGTDSKGRRIGYAVPAKCDHPGCKARIDRGLSYACGGMHGSSDGCEDYFCGDHLKHRYDPGDERAKQFCFSCAAALDEQQADEFTRALTEIAYGADPASTANAALARWDEAPFPAESGEGSGAHDASAKGQHGLTPNPPPIKPEGKDVGS